MANTSTTEQEIQVVKGTEKLNVEGARVHNLKNINVEIPRDQLTVITGLSGSGKSSLAFDTIYAEGQRRYIESFASYARQFLGNLEKPDVDKITGLNPVISIEQKTISRNPRSTVGTITELYDFLRLLYSKVGVAYSYVTGNKMVKYTDKQIAALIMEQYEGKLINVLAPVVKGRKGHYRELFEQIRKQGYLKARVDGEIIDIEPRLQLDRYKIHDIEIVIDRVEVNEASSKRLRDAIDLSMKKGKGTMMINEKGQSECKFYSRNLMCPDSGIAYDDPAPNFFSFNSPYGACPKCSGIGLVSQIDMKKVIPDPKKSIEQGGIGPIRETASAWLKNQIRALGEVYGFNLKTPIEDISEEGLEALLYGTDKLMDKGPTFESESAPKVNFEGIARFIIRLYQENPSKGVSRWAYGFLNKIECPECEGARIRKEARHFRIGKHSINELAQLDLKDLKSWLDGLDTGLKGNDKIIAAEIIKELDKRLSFLLDIGLTYLTLNRSAKTLSGGEAQRIRLATQIGSQLVGVLYILDEPSIGLHQRDNDMLIASLKQLRDLGNTIIVVEHDKEIMMAADHLIDIGPAAGIHGGEIVAEGDVKAFMKSHTITSDYLSGEKNIVVPAKRRKSNGQKIKVVKANGNNLNDVSVTFPLGQFICVTGVSGSGKSTLINQTLYPSLTKHLYRSVTQPLPHQKIEGMDHIDKVIDIDQSPIGRTPRSNPATYTGVFTEIRNLFTQLPESKIRGYKPGRFSFNVKGGRCEECQGAGLRTIEMNFLPDVYVECSTCNGQRYNRETLEIRYRGKNIADVLDMTIDHAVTFFENIPKIVQKIKTIKEVGLGYIKLGQQSTTLSGGEAQRIKLAAELSKRATGKTFYILDEPSTGLHFEDIRILLDVLNKLVDKGNTVLVIEHNLDIIKVADHLIDLGPEGGNGGGKIVTQGTPEKVAKSGLGHTSGYLKSELGL